MTSCRCGMPGDGWRGHAPRRERGGGARSPRWGGHLGVAEFPTTGAGHRQLARVLVESFRDLDQRVGVEGTGSYGAGALEVPAQLRCGGQAVEVDRPNRQKRRRTGKSDPVDAIEAAHAALSGRAQGAGKTPATATWRQSERSSWRSALRAPPRSRPSTRSAISASPPQKSSANDSKGISRPAPRRRGGRAPPTTASERRPGGLCHQDGAFPFFGHRVPGPRCRGGAPLNVLLTELVEETAPELLGLYGVGVDTAATLLVTAGDNPGRIR